MKDYGFSQDRLTKRARLISFGVDPYPSISRRSHFINQILSNSSQLVSKEVDLAGRIVVIDNSSLPNFTIEDVSGRIDVHIDENVFAKHQLLLNNIDAGDFVGVKGVVRQSASTDPFLQLTELTVLTKALMDLPAPVDWAKNKDGQRSQRYVDLAIRKEARGIFRTRVKLIRNIRRFLDEQGMCEVETPILRSWYDLVCVDQFTTKDITGLSLYMRLCHEDRLKQLVSGGFGKVYEIGKSFRRGEVSWKHSPEFTQLETIQAYTDYRDMMKHAEDLISIVTQRTLDKTTINGRGGDAISLLPPWQKITVRDAILKYVGIDIYSVSTPEAFRQEIVKRVGGVVDRSVSSPRVESVTLPPADIPAGAKALPPEPYCNWFWGLVEHCIETFVAPNLIQPTIVSDYPLDSNWQVKRKRDRPDYLERFEAYIDGIEIANCYTLVNDPVDYVERLEDQLGWYCIAFGRGDYPLDLSLIRAKAYGLPPMSESSFGIDRWLMMVCEQESIQDVIWMPYPHI